MSVYFVQYHLALVQLIFLNWFMWCSHHLIFSLSLQFPISTSIYNSSSFSLWQTRMCLTPLSYKWIHRCTDDWILVIGSSLKCLRIYKGKHYANLATLSWNKSHKTMLSYFKDSRQQITTHIYELLLKMIWQKV